MNRLEQQIASTSIRRRRVRSGTHDTPLRSRRIVSREIVSIVNSTPRRVAHSHGTRRCSRSQPGTRHETTAAPSRTTTASSPLSTPAANWVR